ncbi:unnamed protein product [Brassicogethes aeneus]|uniref:Aldehyde dehydrogenase domain-containing protein n=1 Tax=Brassicogethes aeneus TaxID=1431903 RepID=A0A9P0FN23_BRAAE|nr:unnamed protein product [Brassicogethes aeneus]
MFYSPKKLEVVMEKFYGGNSVTSPSLSKIINERYFDRLLGLIKHDNIAVGGQYDRTKRIMTPTILRDCKPNDPVMQDEIFGPILPICTVKNVEEAIDFIKSRDKPLALYIFSKNKKVHDTVLTQTSSGGAAVNDSVSHLITEGIPFGGVGASGMGAYHGKQGFDTFTHKKGVLKKDLSSFSELGLSLRYPPYTDQKTALMTFILKRRKGVAFCKLETLITFLLGMVFAFIVNYLFM